MRTTFAVAAFVSGLSTVLAQTTLFANTPTSLVTCQPASLSYGGGTAPYFLSIIPGGNAAAAALESFPSSATTTAGAYVWTVNIAAGTSVTVAIRDSQGTVNYSDKVTILAGPDTSCVGVSSSAGAAGASTSAAGAATSSAAAGATTSKAGAATSSSAAAASSTTAAAATTSKAGSASFVGANLLAVVGACALAIAA